MIESFQSQFTNYIDTVSVCHSVIVLTDEIVELRRLKPT